MLNDIRATWALLVGIAFMMLGNGLQVSLLGLRATIEGFSTFETGVMQAGYFIGIIIGSLLAPHLVRRVGHVRVFAALASLASIAILAHSLYISLGTWMFMRVITGISYAGVYVVTESWLNDRAGNETRGKLLSVYMVIVTMGLGGGQLMLNLAEPMSKDLFILASVVVSLGLIPMLLAARPAPAFDSPGKISFRRLYEASPLAVTGNMLSGIAHGTIFSLGAVYAKQRGLNNEDVSIFMACFMFGGLVLQWPIGIIVDYIERRIVILIISVTAFILCFLAAFLPATGWLFYLVTALIGSVVMPVYSVFVAYANDRLEPEEIVSASGMLVMVAGIGLSIGPIMISLLMENFGESFFFIGIGSTFLIIALYALYRMYKREGVGLDAQVPSFETGMIGTSVSEIITTDPESYVDAVIRGEVERLDEVDELSDGIDRRL